MSLQQEDITINLSPPTPSSDSILPTQLTQLSPQPSSVPSLAPPSASPSSPLSVPSSASISETVSSSVPSLTPPSAPPPSPLLVPSSPSLSVLSPMAYECSTEQILYLLDRYGVSDEFYHELTMVTKCLPRSHRVKALRRQISETVPYIRLPSPFDGCYRPFEGTLRESLQSLSNEGVEVSSPIEVKLSGDGAPFYRSTSFILLSFSLPSLDPNSISATGKIIIIMCVNT